MTEATQDELRKMAERVLSPGYFHFKDPALLPQRADECRDVARALLKFIDTQAPQGWRPIESAPRTAKDIMLRVPTRAKVISPQHFVVIGHWAEDTSGEYQPPFRGFFRWDGYQMVGIIGATHWAPYTEPTPPQHGVE